LKIIESRHVATLALVGWYLLMPPWYEDKRAPDWNAPLNQWVINQSFDTAGECETIRLKLIKKDFSSDAMVNHRARVSACVSTDDPRLKEK
jgi:hypothetical protein